MPINKNLWTSSYVVYAAGWSLLLLALFHWLFDLRGAYPLGRSMGIRMPITAYAGSWLMAAVSSRKAGRICSGLLRRLRRCWMRANSRH